MAIMGFIVRPDKIDPAIVSINSFLKYNPTWTVTVYYDSDEVLSRLMQAFPNNPTVEYTNVPACCPVETLYWIFTNETTHGRLCLFSPNDLCQRPLTDLDTADLSTYDLVVRPDRAFDLTDIGDDYPLFDPDHNSRIERSSSYFTCGVTVYNLERIRNGFSMSNFIDGWRDDACPDKGFYKHYLNRFFDGAAKGIMPGHIGVKPDPYMTRAMTYSMAMRHHVRLMTASVANYSGPIYPWSTEVVRDKRFLQVPFREYLNAAYPVREHLSEAFYETVKENARVWLVYYGNMADAFNRAYDIEIV